MDDARDERRRRRISRAETRRVVNGARERANAPQHGQHFMIRSVIEPPFHLREMWSTWTAIVPSFLGPIYHLSSIGFQKC